MIKTRFGPFSCSQHSKREDKRQWPAFHGLVIPLNPPSNSYHTCLHEKASQIGKFWVTYKSQACLAILDAHFIYPLGSYCTIINLNYHIFECNSVRQSRALSNPVTQLY